MNTNENKTEENAQEILNSSNDFTITKEGTEDALSDILRKNKRGVTQRPTITKEGTQFKTLGTPSYSHRYFKDTKPIKFDDYVLNEQRQRGFRPSICWGFR